MGKDRTSDYQKLGPPTAGVARNTGLATLGQIASAIGGYVLLYVTALVLGRSGVGVLGLLISVSLLGQILAVLGLNVLITRTVAQHPADADAALGQSLLLAAAGGTAVAALIILATYLGLFPGDAAGPTRLVALAVLPGAMAAICEGFVNGRERLGLNTLSNVAESLLRLILAVSLLWATDWGAYGLALSLVISRVAALCFDLWLIRFRLDTRPLLARMSGIRAMVAAALPLSAIFVLLTVFSRGDVLVVGKIAGTAQVGVYVAGNRPVELAAMVPLSLLLALYPALSRQLASDPDAARAALERALVLTTAIMAGVAITLAFKADFAVRLLYPSRLAGAAAVLSVTAWYLIPLAIDAATTAILLAEGRFMAALLPLSLGAITLIGVNLVLDPGLGALGAAAARLAGQCVASAVNAPLALRGWGGIRLWRQLAGVALSGILLTGVLLLPLPAVAAILLGMAVYLVACLLTGVVAPSDGRVLVAVLSRRP